MELDDLRQRIDRVDAELVRLFEERMELSRRVGACKKERGLPVFDPARERELLDDRTGRLSDPKLSEDLRAFFSFLMEAGKALQRQAPQDGGTAPGLPSRTGPAAYQGIRGAYGEQAARLYFGDGSELTGVARFEDVFRAVENGEVRAGVIPVENLLTGGIPEVYDLFERHRCAITGEQTLKIEHCLLTLPGARLSDIRRVVSHPQGLLQCSDYLDEHPEWERVARLNTAEAARCAAQGGDRSVAAVASAYAAGCWGLEIRERDIANAKENRTRFAVLGPEGASGGGDKYTLSLVLGHSVGTLRAGLEALAQNGFSLTFIQSRPYPGRSWEYRFYIDCIAAGGDCDMARALKTLHECGARARLLGRYAPAGETV